MNGILFGTDETAVDKFTNLGMKGAEAADRFTLESDMECL